MRIKRKIEEEIKIYYTMLELLKGHIEHVRDYLERHGWKECGGYSGEVYIDRKEYAGHYKYVKQFQSEDEMKNEMEDVYALLSLTEQ